MTMTSRSGSDGEGLRPPFEWKAGDLARMAGLVRRIVASRGYRIPQDERADVAQEAMLQLWRALAPSGARITSLEGLTATIAHRSCVAWLRRRRRLEEVPADLPDRSSSAEEDLILEERRALGLRVIATMPKGCREVLRLHVVLRMSYREIAERLDRSEHGLRTQVCECLRRARGVLERLRRGRTS